MRDGESRVWSIFVCDSLTPVFIRAFPCWDEPARKATFTLTLTVDHAIEALSNMPEAENKILASGKRRITFMPTPRMSTYLLCWCVGEFDSIAAMTKSGVICKVHLKVLSV